MVVFFTLTALLLVLSAIGVVAMKNPVHNALCLLVNLLGVAAVYAMLEAHFLAVVQIIVYAGAVVVLVLFVIMLLNLKDEGRQKFGALYVLFGSLALIGFLALALPLFRDAGLVFQTPEHLTAGTTRELGSVLFGRYVFAFEMAGVLLLAATVGAVMVARKKIKGEGA